MVFVLENGIIVSVHPYAVAEHILLVVEESVSAEIVGKVGGLVNGAIGGGGIHCFELAIYAVSLSSKS